MSTQRKIRKDKQVSEQEPINFTCGKCRKVHKYDSDNHLKCPDAEEEIASEE